MDNSKYIQEQDKRFLKNGANGVCLFYWKCRSERSYNISSYLHVLSFKGTEDRTDDSRFRYEWFANFIQA